MTAIPRVLCNKLVAWSLALACGLPCLTTQSHAQTAYPEKPVVLVVPYEAGGASDRFGRFLAVTLASSLKQPVHVDNKPGDGTAMAAAWLANAEPDGYTLMLASGSTLVLNPAMRNNLGYDPFKSFTPVGLMAEMHLLVLSDPAKGPASLSAMMVQAKANPRSATYGSYGTGSTSFFAGEMLKAMTDTPLAHVPSDGSASNLRALMEGKITVASDTVGAASPLIKLGKIKPLATFAPARLDSLPDVPTMIELGYPELTLSAWFTLIAPKNLPAPVVEKLQAVLKNIAISPEFNTQLQELGIHPRWADGAEVIMRVRKELPKMKAIVQLDEIKG